MKKTKMKVLTVIGLILLAGIYYYVKLPAINIHAAGFWTFLLVVIAALAVIYIGKKKLFRKEEIKQSGIAKGLIGLFVLIGVIYLGGTLLSSPIINAKKYQKLLTVEEHSVIGGLGDAVADVLMGKICCQFKKIGVQDQFGQSGKAKDVLREYGLTAPQIAESILSVF